MLKPTRLKTDASHSGLGTILEQLHITHWKPGAYALGDRQPSKHEINNDRKCLHSIF